MARYGADCGLGIGIGGNRPDDFVVEGLPPTGLGKRIDRDLETYHNVWRGAPRGGDTNASVPAGTRPVPLLIGGLVPMSFARMAEWGQGYVGGTVPASMVEPHFRGARVAWQENGRAGSPRLVALAYFSIGDPDRARATVHDYYSSIGPEFAAMSAGNVAAHRGRHPRRDEVVR